MSRIVIKNLKVSDLPMEWARKLNVGADQMVTVSIETETGSQSAAPPENLKAQDSAFGMWRDRTDMADVDAFARELREPRYSRN